MEENKVRDTIAEVISRFSENWHANYHISVAGAKPIASAILQSPDLRVTIREPRYFISYRGEKWFEISDRHDDSLEVVAGFCVLSEAEAYINSKEPK